MVQAHRGMKSAIWLPLFNDLADPRIVSRIAVAAEEAGWHGCSCGATCCGRHPWNPSPTHG